jgi:hypothetical protein
MGQYGSLALWGTGNVGSHGTGPDTIVDSPDGGNFVGMDGDFSGHQQPLEQVIHGLTPGKTYTVGFDYAFAQQYGFDQDTNQYWTVSLSGVTFNRSGPGRREEATRTKPCRQPRIKNHSHGQRPGAAAQDKIAENDPLRRCRWALLSSLAVTLSRGRKTMDPE